MVKRDGIWKIAHFQNTVIDPKTENDDLPKWDATGFPPPGHPLRRRGAPRSIAPEQKDDILCNNPARFLRLDSGICRHSGPGERKTRRHTR